MIRVFQVKCENESDIPAALMKKLDMPAKDLLSWKIHRVSVDARKTKVFFSYIIDAKVKHEKRYLKMKDVMKKPSEHYSFSPSGTLPLENRPVVAGFGPAGMFAALLLCQYGYKPIVLEKGSRIDKRQKDVDLFWKQGLFNPSSNVQYGEGGAGAFSDGKLTTRSKDILGRKVLQELVHFGASEKILIEQHPHIGTDAFVKIIENLRNACIQMGAEFLFDTALAGLDEQDGKLAGLKLSSGAFLPCQACILATGHSAVDVYEFLHQAGVNMEAKPFAVGVRIEHDQKFIDQAMLKEACTNPALLPARYQLTHKASNGKGVYTFCMCPGGYVINSSSEPGQLVVNGMSYAARDGKNANSALLVQVDAGDTGEGVQAGLDFQKKLEADAFALAGSNWKAPVQLAKDYLEHKVSAGFEGVEPTLENGTAFADLNTLFPQAVNQALHEALEAFEQAVPGFVSSGAVLTAPESRSSAAVKIVRDSSSRMASMPGLFPAGEGSGYAGGIMTSAIDGLHAAQALMERYACPDLDKE